MSDAAAAAQATRQNASAVLDLAANVNHETEALRLAVEDFLVKLRNKRNEQGDAIHLGALRA